MWDSATHSRAGDAMRGSNIEPLIVGAIHFK
ncbi:hypothetical protein CCACVL1_25773 [Corchorus capsularis]|uniref:Uncharacterized protein n=1 Tax=Corchorus capsularis TaxID=210143 RepID=A0A1R3GH35_COCAP|nr:hypothetical protein CCACVL1_25773 [Corchorus capsularis]